MNCKPGDLAVVVRAPKVVECHIGKTVRCIALVKSWDGLPCWTIKPFRDHIGNCTGIADRDLQPIRGNSAPSAIAETTEESNERERVA